jgi:hypothetical protein
MMKCAILLPVFSLLNQSKAFRKDTVFFLLPPFSTECAEMAGFPYAHKSRAFERKHGAASRNTLSGLLGSSISRTGKRTKIPLAFEVRPEVVLVNSHDKSSAYRFIAVCFAWCAPMAWSFPMAPSNGSPSNIPGSIPIPLSRLLSKSSMLSLTS